MIEFIVWEGLQIIIGLTIGIMGIRGVKRIERRQSERLKKPM